MVGSAQPPSSRGDAGGQLLRELEALSQALYKAKSSSRREPETRTLTFHSQGFEKPTTITDLPDLLGLDDCSAPAPANQQRVEKKKKGGKLWDWKPLRALAHIGQSKFDCEFAAHVHGITKLPAPLEGLRLQVRLKHKDLDSRTVPSLVFKGSADFEETLRMKCAVYGSTGSGGGLKFISKTFTLSVVAPDASELELGKHRLDLSRILPDGGVGGRSGSTWNTSFKLSGRARGGILTITFGYELGRSSSLRREEGEGEVQELPGRGKYFYPKSPEVRGAAGLKSFNSLPNSPEAWVAARKQEHEYAIDIENLNLDEESVDDDCTAMTMSNSSGLLAPETPGRQEEEELKALSVEQSDDFRGEDDDDEEEVGEFSVIERGVEEASHEKREIHPEMAEGSRMSDARLSDDLDEEAQMFLHMLGPGSDSEEALEYSPRGILLKEFEMEQQQRQSSLIMIQNITPRPEEEPGCGLFEFMDAAESELQKATQAMKSKARAKMLEDAEAEALMQEWGLNERAFQNSPSAGGGGGGGSLIPSDLNALVLVQDPPCLAEGLGSMIPTRDGGSLRSMNPTHFQGGRNDGRLVLQVSKPVVVPAEMGSGVLEIFQSLAAGGAENMAFQVTEAMPLEDITGKNIYQIAMEGQASVDMQKKKKYALSAGENRYALEYAAGASGELVAGSSSAGGALYDRRQRRAAKRAGADDTFVSLEELAPVAMEKIEALAMQGLKIQSDMAEEEAPYSLESYIPTGNLLEAGDSSCSSSSMHLLEGGSSSSGSSGDELMAMSISLDEWMRLDAGVYDESETSEKTKAVLAAHHAAHSTDIVLLANEEGGVARRTDDFKPGIGAGAGAGAPGGAGLMGDTLTLAMLVQLRDPLRNYEPVGAPMMAFVQAERVMVPPKPKMFRRVSMQGNSEQLLEEESDQPQVPEFKITGVHMAGLKPGESSGAGDNKKKIWGTQKQQQSGSRWLLAHGMGKTGAPKHPLLKSSKAAASGSGAAAASNSSAAPVTSSAAAAAPAASNSTASKSSKQGGESLWSISARMGSSKSTKAAAASITRNPDVKFGSRLSFGKKKW